MLIQYCLQNDTSLAPMPLNQNVSLAAGYGGVFAVASYGGIADGASVQSTGSQLKADLAATGIKFKEPYLSVIYDVPVRYLTFIHRICEILAQCSSYQLWTLQHKATIHPCVYAPPSSTLHVLPAILNA